MLLQVLLKPMEHTVSLLQQEQPSTLPSLIAKARAALVDFLSRHSARGQLCPDLPLDKSHHCALALMLQVYSSLHTF